LFSHPTSLENVAEFITSEIGDQFSQRVEGLGKVTTFINEDEREALAAGEISDFNPTAYLIEPLIADALTVEVNDTATELTAMMGDTSFNTNFTFNSDVESYGSYTLITSITEYDYTRYIDEWSQTQGVDLDYPTVTYSKTVDAWDWHYQVTITPIDFDEDNIADVFHVIYDEGSNFNNVGVLEGIHTTYHWEFSSYDDNNWNQRFDWALGYNPLSLDNAITVYESIIDKNDGLIQGYQDGIGDIEVELSEGDVATIVAGSTTTFDGLNTQIHSRTRLEDQDNFLNVNAAISLEAILGDYQVKLQLSGDRSALEQGAFELEMSYRLPDADSQRSFTVQYNTEIEGRVTVNNADGVVLVLEEPAQETQGTQTIGQILVGPEAFVAATIENRDGTIWVVYADTDGDGFQVEHSL